MLTYQDVVLGLSALANLFLTYQLYLKKKKRPLSQSAQEVLHDMTRPGGAILAIEIMNPEHIFLRSPRDLK